MSKKFTSTIAGASILITIVGLLSRGFGFLREIIFAAFFGLGNEFELYLIASVFPITINSVLLYLGQNYYIPIHSQIKGYGIKRETELFTRIVFMFFAGGFLLAVILFFLSKYVLNFYLSASDPTKMGTALIVFRILVFTIPINAAISIISAHLQSQRNFSSPALAQLFANLSVIVLVPLLSKSSGIIIIPIAYLVGSLFQISFLFSKVKNFLFIEYKSPLKNAFFQFKNYANASLLLIIVIEVIGQFYLIIDRYFYDKVELGGIAALNYAITVFYIPIAILSVALSTAIFPSFSENLQHNIPDAFVKKVNNSISVNIFLFAPILIVFLFYGDFIIRLFFQRGSFSKLDTKMTFSALQYFSFSLIFYSAFSIFNKIFYGARLIKHLLFISIIGIIIKLILNYTLATSMKQNGLALSSSISYSFLCLAALFVLNYKLRISLKVLFWKNSIICIINSVLSYVISSIIVSSFLTENNTVNVASVLLFLTIYLFNAYMLKDYSIILLKEAWISYRNS